MLDGQEHKRRRLAEYQWSYFLYNENAQNAPLNGPNNLFTIFQVFWIHTIALDKDQTKF